MEKSILPKCKYCNGDTVIDIIESTYYANYILVCKECKKENKVNIFKKKKIINFFKNRKIDINGFLIGESDTHE